MCQAEILIQVKAVIFDWPVKSNLKKRPLLKARLLPLYASIKTLAFS